MRWAAGWLLAAFCLLAPALFSTRDYGVSSAVREVFVLLGAIAALVVLVWLHWSRITSWLSREVTTLASPSVIAALPPRIVLSALLRRIYGEGGHESVLAGILGGAGLDVHGRDIATSRRTIVEVRLTSIDDKLYDAVIVWRHRLSGVLASYKFVVFATCDPELWNILPSERRVPLYESWFVQDEDALNSFVPNLLNELTIGISYRDVTGELHTIEPRSLECVQPHTRDYSSFVRLPNGVNLDDLRILEFDLGQLVDADHVMGAIETVSMRAATVERTAHCFLSWSPPYPCYVERMVFDLDGLRLGSEELLFKLVPFTMERPGPSFTHDWIPAHRLGHLALESWLLPGHGVALLWRPASWVSEEVMYGR